MGDGQRWKLRSQQKTTALMKHHLRKFSKWGFGVEFVYRDACNRKSLQIDAGNKRFVEQKEGCGSVEKSMACLEKVREFPLRSDE